MRAQQRGLALVVPAAVLLVIAADSPPAVKSGPQVGARISKSFEVRCCNGPDAGDMACLV
jgi:hypothetical protein